MKVTHDKVQEKTYAGEQAKVKDGRILRQESRVEGQTIVLST